MADDAQLVAGLQRMLATGGVYHATSDDSYVAVALAHPELFTASQLLGTDPQLWELASVGVWGGIVPGVGAVRGGPQVAIDELPPTLGSDPRQTSNDDQRFGISGGLGQVFGGADRQPAPPPEAKTNPLVYLGFGLAAILVIGMFTRN